MLDVRPLRWLCLLFLFAVALVVAPQTASARTNKVFSSTEVEGYAAGSTHVVVGRFVGWERERSLDFERPLSVQRIYGDVALARVHVERVIAGSNDVVGRNIVVIGDYAQHAGDGAVLFLRYDEGRFSIVGHGLFRITGGDVALRTASDKSTLPLDELTAMVRAAHPVRVKWSAQIADHAREDGRLHVVFVAKNGGDEAVNVLPPSRCQSVKAYPLDARGFYDANRGWMHPGVWFDGLDDPSPLLAPGERRSFEYDVPLASIGIGHGGQWDVVLGMAESFCAVHRDGAVHVLPNYMADRVVRVTIDPSSAPVRAARMKSAPPAWADVHLEEGAAARAEGCSATTASPRRAVHRALALVCVLVVAGIVLARRTRRRPG